MSEKEQIANKENAKMVLEFMKKDFEDYVNIHHLEDIEPSAKH